MAVFQFSNSPTVSFGSNASSIYTASAAGGPAAGIAGIAGSGASTVTNGTLVFSNLNGVSFGLNGSTMTASHNAITSQSVQTQGSVQINGSTGAITISGSALASVSNNGSTVIVSVRSLSLDEVQNPANSRNFNCGTRNVGFEFNGVGTNPSFQGAFQIEEIGNFSGDLVHIHQHGGGPNPSDLLHLEAEHTNVTIMRMAGAASVGCEISMSNTAMPFKVLNTQGTVMCESLNVEMVGGRVSSYFAVSNHTHGALALTGINGTSSSNGLSLSVTGGAGGGIGGIAGSAASTVTSGTVVFSNMNLVSFGLNGSTMTASIPVAITRFDLIGNTAGLTTVTGPSVQICGGNNITVSGNGGDSFTISAKSQFPGAFIGDGGNSITSGNVSFANSNGATIGIGGNSVSIDYAGPRAVAASNAGSSLTKGTLVFSNANGVSFGFAGSTITASVRTGTAGAQTLSVWPFDMAAAYGTTATPYTGASGATGASTQFTASGFLYSVAIPAQVEFQDLDMTIVPQVTSGGTGSATLGLCFGIYTLNANTRLDLLSSFHFGAVASHSSVTRISYQWWWGTDSNANSSGLTTSGTGPTISFSGTRRVFLNQTNLTLPSGNYYFGAMMTQRTSSVNIFGLASYFYFTASGTQNNSSIFGHNSISKPDLGFGGLFSVTTNTNVIIGGLYMPATIATADITNSGGASQWVRPAVQMYRVST